MSESVRKRAFVWIAAIVIAAVLLMPRDCGSPGNPETDEGAAEPVSDRSNGPSVSAAEGAGPLVLGARPRAEDRRAARVESFGSSPGEAADLDRIARRAARPAALRFVRAFARFQRDPFSVAARAQLRATAGSDLYADLIGQPPRIPPDQERVAPRLRGLWLDGPLDGRMTAIAQLAAPGSREQVPLQIALEQQGRRWLVVELLPY